MLSNADNKGFTLFEVLTAIFIISMGIGVASTAIQRTAAFASDSTKRFIAAYLAQEGIEIVRNIRDTNWLQSRSADSPWNDGLPAGDWEMDYTTVTFADTANFEKCSDPGYNCDTYDGDFLKIDSGYYKYSSFGTITPFKRKITLTSVGSDELKVSAEITWEGRGQTHKITVQENLYNWRK